jgi:gluconate kinase
MIQMLDSQLAILEEPTNEDGAFSVDISASPREITMEASIKMLQMVSAK